MVTQWKVSFTVSEKDYNRGQKLPRSFNISEKMREAYTKILKDAGV